MLMLSVAMKVAKERKSSVLASNAVHHRVDSLTSIVALLAIGGSHLIKGATWLDPVGGLLVSLMVIQAGFGNTVSAIYELCDKGIDDEVKTAIKRAADKALAISEAVVREVQGVKAGQNYLLDIELAVPKSWNLEQMKVAEDAVRQRVGAKVRGARRIRIRFVPEQDPLDNFKDEFIADVSPRSSPEPEAEEDHIHEHHHHDEHAGTSGKSREWERTPPALKIGHGVHK